MSRGDIGGISSDLSPAEPSGGVEQRGCRPAWPQAAASLRVADAHAVLVLCGGLEWNDAPPVPLVMVVYDRNGAVVLVATVRRQAGGSERWL